ELVDRHLHLGAGVVRRPRSRRRACGSGPLPQHGRGLRPEYHVWFEAAAAITVFLLIGKLTEDRAKTATIHCQPAKCQPMTIEIATIGTARISEPMKRGRRCRGS